MVLDVGRDDVLEVVAFLLQFGAYFGGEGCGGEDGEGAGGEADWGEVSWISVGEGRGEDIPIVPRPPMRKRPKRENGAERVVMLGVMSRMTITAEGLLGMSLDVMASVVVELCDVWMLMCSKLVCLSLLLFEVVLVGQIRSFESQGIQIILYRFQT